MEKRNNRVSLEVESKVKLNEIVGVNNNCGVKSSEFNFKKVLSKIEVNEVMTVFEEEKCTSEVKEVKCLEDKDEERLSNEVKSVNSGVRMEKIKSKSIVSQPVEKVSESHRDWSVSTTVKSMKSASSVCRCGNVLKVSTNGIIGLVELFEHVYASGSPNFACCRIPVPNSNLNIPRWRALLRGYEDEAICDLLEYGFPLDFNKNQKLSYSERRNHKGARDYPEFINKYLDRECGANRIAGPFHKNPLSVPLVVSPMNSVPKDSVDERRAIVDLSWPKGTSVNDGISKETYLGRVINLHYASVEQVCRMVLKVGLGAHIYKRDLRHAYRQIPVDPHDYQYLGYYWEENMYFDTVLAMGQRNAAMACSRTTKAVMHVHEKAGYSGTSYLDDLIGVAEALVSEKAYDHLGGTLSYLGLSENFSKACAPATVQIVLGIEIDTVAGTVAVPECRMNEIIPLVRNWQRKRKTNKVDLQSLIGKLQFITKCVLQSRVFLNRLLDALRSMKNQKSITLSASFKKDLKWWSMFVRDYNGVSFIPAMGWDEPDVTFATDSCLEGCGGICFKEYFHVAFPKSIKDQRLRIHHLEMLAVLVGVRIWGKYCIGMKVQIFCDNDAVVHVINSSKTKDVFLGSCLRELWLEVARHGFELRAIHLPGVENRVPDWLSRWNLGKKYRDLFHNFIGSEADQYIEIPILEDLFLFSGEL